MGFNVSYHLSIAIAGTDLSHPVVRSRFSMTNHNNVVDSGLQWSMHPATAH